MGFWDLILPNFLNPSAYKECCWECRYFDKSTWNEYDRFICKEKGEIRYRETNDILKQKCFCEDSKYGGVKYFKWR